MPPMSEFELVYAVQTLGHLDAIERKYHRLIERTIAQQLRYTPEHVTRNRKPLERLGPFGATWELRFGPNNRLRVLYEVNSEERTVEILAIRGKGGNRLVFGRE